MPREEMDLLKAQVEKTVTVEGSAIVFINGLKAELDQAIADQDWEAVKALTADLGSSSQLIADAIVAGTPAAKAA